MRILYKHEDGSRTVRVYEAVCNGEKFYYDGTALYTQVDRHGNNRLNYIDAMDAALRDASEVLMLGTAGGALATAIARRGGQVTAIDNWAGAFDVARQWFQMPSEVECVHADALSFLRDTDRQWDGVAIDVFRGVEIPAAMFANDIGPLLSTALRPGGLAVWNVADHPDAWSTKRVVLAFKRAGLEPTLHAVLDGDVGNTLVLARKPLAIGDTSNDVLGAFDQANAASCTFTSGAGLDKFDPGFVECVDHFLKTIDDRSHDTVAGFHPLNGRHGHAGNAG